YWWARPGVPGLPRKMLSVKISPWATGEVLAGKTVVYSNPEELPKEEVKLRQFLKTHGPKAQVMLPLQIGGIVLGALTFGKFRAPRYWSPSEMQRLRIVGQIIASALERKRAVLQSRKLQGELAVASRRSTMGELTASIAHELNQPLTAVLSSLGGLARLLSQGNLKPSLTSAAVRNAIEDTKRAGEIVRRLRSMFRGDETHKVAINISPLAKEIVNLVGSEAASREIILRIDDSPILPRVIGDRLQIQQCLLNLLMNALDATAQTESGPREVTIRIAPEKIGWIGVSVCDTGPGVDPSVANRMFESFVTTKTKGMGLGLLVTRSIVEGHGGRIWFTPNSGGGSTFTFTLPIAQEQQARASRRAR
ncbi:MAG: ATP-binding protein, partial [Candidatus Binataceae bacterium]